MIDEKLKRAYVGHWFKHGRSQKKGGICVCAFVCERMCVAV